jgi:cation transport ATPase
VPPAGHPVPRCRRDRDAAPIDTLVVDKTGTLTVGKPSFDRAIAAPGFEEQEVMRLAASLDQGSEHPLAAAIVTEAGSARSRCPKADEFDSASGTGCGRWTDTSSRSATPR